MKLLRKLLALALTLSMLTAPALALTTEQAHELLKTYYIDDLPERVGRETTVEDMLEALGDPYTQYFDAKSYAAFLDSMKDSVVYGIGVTMEFGDGGILVTGVIPGFGAEKAGILPGDLLTAVDGHPTAGEGTDAVRARLSGPDGTKVSVTVSRGGAAHTYTITRAKIVVPATDTVLVDGHIGYIRSSAFGPETLGHFTDGIKAHNAAADRWIVDLRSNGGGDTQVAVQAAGAFAGSGELSYLRAAGGRYGALVGEEESLTMGPVVVLTDGHTASAAEMFASIIRDRRAGLVVGGRTFGKGVAQLLLDDSVLPEYFADGSALKVTAYRIFSPNGTTTDRVGVLPHLLVDPRLAPDVARLLSDSNPKGDTLGKLRLDIGWRWYIDLNTALTPDMRAAFTALLEAIPEGTPLWRGTGGPEGWASVTPAELAREHALTSYAPRGFSDTGESPYAGEIARLATYGIAVGPGDGTFRPEESLTRGQLCALLAQALRYRPTGRMGTFADVDPNAYYAGAVEALYAVGLVQGVGDGSFRPDDPIDHQQYSTVLARLAQRLSMEMEMTAGAIYEEFLAGDTALAPFAPWAREGVWLLGKSQQNPLGEYVSLLWSPLDQITPAAPTTRAEAAAGLYNLLAYTGILP